MVSSSDGERSQSTIKLGQKIKALRKQQNLKQDDLAERAGVNRSYLSLVENGKSSPTIDVIEKLAKALGVDFKTLLETEKSNSTVIEGKHFEYDTGEEFDIYPGLKDFLEDEDEMILAQPTLEEVLLLKSIRFSGYFRPDKRFYREALLSYRRSRKSSS